MKSVATFLTAGVTLLSMAMQSREASAAIANQSQNFTTGTFADNAALAAAGYTFTDLSGLGGPTGGNGLDTAQVSGDPNGGDGVNDGGIFLDGFTINETVTYPFVGTITNGGSYLFGANLFRSASSGTDADVELLANGVVVASLPKQGRLNGTDTASPTANDAPISLYYKGTAATAGQTLAFRMRQVRGNDGTFDVGIDNWAITNRSTSPIANQTETFAGVVPFGYQWSLDASNGNGGFWDAGANNPVTSAIGILPGDAAQDGAIFANGNNNGTTPPGSPISTVSYRFNGVIENGKQYDFSTYLYQSSTSFAQTDVQLVADPGGPGETVVATVDPGGINNTKLNLVGVSYTGTAATAGKELGFRISSKRPAGTGSSDLAIDSWALESFDPNAPLANQSETFNNSVVPTGYTFSAAGGGLVVPDAIDVFADGVTPADGASDGAIFINGNAAPVVEPPTPEGPPTTVTKTLRGKIADGQAYSFSSYLYQSSTSFGESTIDLIADLGGAGETVVATLFQTPVNGSGNVVAPPRPEFNLVTLGFTGSAATNGKSLSFRISSERGIGNSSDVGIDSWALSLTTSADPGDFDVDGDVDGNDFLVWQRRIPESAQLGRSESLENQFWRTRRTSGGRSTGTGVDDAAVAQRHNRVGVAPNTCLRVDVDRD